MDNKKNNGNGNESLSFLTDEEALTEIDFGSFLDETARGSDVFEGFHEDIEKTEKSLESELESLYEDIMSSGPATIVPKPMSVITSEDAAESEKTSSESGLEELWMSPEEYFDIPVVSLDDAEEIEAEAIPEEAVFTPEPTADEPEKEETPVAPTSEDIKGDIFGMIDSMKSETESETGFGDILAEIESNAEIAPVSDDYESIAGFLSTLPVVELPEEETSASAEAPAPEEKPAEPEKSAPATEDKPSVIEEEATSTEEMPSAPEETITVPQESEMPASEKRVISESDEFEKELAFLLGETEAEEAGKDDGDAFIISIPDDGNDYGFAADQSEDEEDGSAPSTEHFGYTNIVPEQPERVIGDFEAAEKAALEAEAEESKEEKKARKQREKAEKKTGEKVRIGAGEIVRRIVLTLAILVIIASGGILVNTYIVQPALAKKLISDTVSDLSDGLKEHGDAEIDSSISSKYDVNFPMGMLAKYAPLYASNTDLRGWISIPAFEINLPVVQGTDNDYYLKRNIYKKWTEYGVPFFDYRIAQGQFVNLPRNTVIYGHNMRSDDLIFGMLEEYRDIDGFKRAPVIECNTIYGNYNWVICGVFISNSKAEHDNGYVFPYNFIDCSDQKFAEYIVELEKRRFYDTGVDLAITDKILTLSTCCYDFPDARLVVVARLLRDGESVSVDTSKAIKNPDPKGPQAWYDENGKPNNYAYDARW